MQYHGDGSSMKRHSLEVLARNQTVCGLFYCGQYPGSVTRRTILAYRAWALNRAAPVTISPMLKSLPLLSIRIFTATVVIALSACSPTYDWREVRGTDAPYVVLLPAKPATHSRAINLDGVQLVMTMTGAEVNGVIFAIGNATLPARTAPQAALNAMKIGLVKNIGGTVRHEKYSLVAGNPVPSIEIEAVGAASGTAAGQPKILFARFTEKDRRIYQVIVVGQENAVERDTVDTFFSSFKLN
jgi:hypothetical protein